MSKTETTTPPIFNYIDCGIGKIEYREPDNLLLQMLMEKLEEAIKKTTPKKVNEILSAI